MYRRLVTLALGAMLVLALALPAAAAQTKMPISGRDVSNGVLDEGTMWFSDRIQHVRGWTAEYVTCGELKEGNTCGDPSEYVDGTSIIVANWNLDTASGDGTMWGTTDLALTAFDGGWHETWVAKFDGGMWSGWGVGRGFGDLQGMKIRFDVRLLPDGTDVFEGFVR